MSWRPLSPSERAAFILREAFDYDYDAIAGVLDSSVVNARKLVSRARARVEDGAPRETPEPDIAIRLAAAFGQAAGQGDMTALEALLHEDVLLRSRWRREGAGRTEPDLRARQGHTLPAGLGEEGRGLSPLGFATVNGGPGFIIRNGDKVHAVASLTTDRGRISNIDIVRNPEKLCRQS